MHLKKFALCLLLSAGTVFAADARVGKWKINIEKSKLRNPAAWKGRTMTIEQIASDTLRVTFETPNANGGVDRRVDIRSPKENPVDGSQGETTISQKIDDYHARTIFKKDGKEIGKLESAISPDGKVTTNTIKGVAAISEEVDGVEGDLVTTVSHSKRFAFGISNKPPMEVFSYNY